MKNLGNKNYTVRFYDKGLKEHFYFAGFVTNGFINGKENIAPTGCPVVVKKMTKERAEKVLARFTLLCGYDKNTKVVEV